MAQWKKVIVSGSTAALASLSVDDLTNDQLVIGGVGGELESSGLTYDGTTLDLSAATTVTGSSFVGTSFSGDGSGLSNITAVGLDIDTFGQDHSGTTLADSDKIAYSKAGQEGRIRLDDVLKHSYDKISNASGTEIAIDSAGVATITTDYMVDVNVGDGLDVTHTTSAGSTATINLDLSEFAIATPTTADYMIFLDGGVSGSHAKGQIGGLIAATAGDGLSFNGGTQKIDVDYGNTANTAVEGNITMSFTGETNEITIDAGSSITLGDGGTVTIGLAPTIKDNRTFSGNLITFNNDIEVDQSASIDGDLTVHKNAVINGDLTVNGTTTSINTANLDVEDRYILLNSGSTGNLDAGIVFGGTNGVAQSGSALIWNANYSGSEGRLGVVNNMAGNANVNVTPEFHIAGAFEGTAAAAATAKADHNGNIRIESGEIYIYA